ncbi:sesquipedalian-1 [Eucyclogobius newberryi]|uniref:sesquipedalian-1 n=1 Tax=Eucyclogobius newberryi TaxID=166745 RepID=UPI003B591B11
MKVHRKLLVHYLSSPSPVDKEGFLFKKKERTGTFHRRWFVLKGNVLFYQERPADRHIGGAIVLEGCAVRTEDSDLDFSLVFEGLRTYRFCVSERWRRDEWVKCLRTASHCYMSLLLRDLGLQYRDALQSCASSNTSFNMTSDLVLTSPSDLGRQTHNPALHQAPLQAPPPCTAATKATARKSPKVWARRNAHVTPLNGPGPLWSEWPAVDFNPLQEFQKLHEFYGREVERVKEEWRRTRDRESEEREEDTDLIDML